MQRIFQEIHFRRSFGSHGSGQRIVSRASRNKLQAQSPFLKFKKEPREKHGRREIANSHDPEKGKTPQRPNIEVRR